MNDEELRSTIEQVKAQVKAKPENAEKSEDEIEEIMLDGFFKAYTEGKMSKEDLGAIAEAMGYEFTEDFDAEAPEAPEEGEEDGGEGEGEGLDATRKELEDTRTIGEGESKEDFKDKIDEIDAREEGDEEVDEDEGEEEEEDEDMDEEEQRTKASELFKMDLKK